MEKHEIKKVLDGMGLSIAVKFIPWSLSRNAGEKYPSLNYKVTLLKNEKEILTTDYMMGCAHCPSYSSRETYNSRQAVKLECEEGFEAKETWSDGNYIVNKKKPMFPDIVDFMYSISMDAEVLDYDFKDWASCFGYDEDSRKAEKIYNECLEIALKLSRTIGNDGINKLREIYQDY